MNAPRISLGLPLLAAAAIQMATAASSATDCAAAEDQFTLNECANLEYKDADARLNQTFQAITARLSELPDTKASLVSAQRAWIAFRDAECTFEAFAVLEGSAYPMIYNGCLTELTSARTQALQVFLNCDETDLSCPVPPE